MSELRDQTNLNSGHGHSLVPTISSRSGGVQLSLPTHDLGWKTSFSVLMRQKERALLDAQESSAVPGPRLRPDGCSQGHR